MGKKKSFIEQIIDGEPVDILDNLPEPYFFLIERGDRLGLLTRAIDLQNIQMDS